MVTTCTTFTDNDNIDTVYQAFEKDLLLCTTYAATTLLPAAIIMSGINNIISGSTSDIQTTINNIIGVAREGSAASSAITTNPCTCLTSDAAAFSKVPQYTTFANITNANFPDLLKKFVGDLQPSTILNSKLLPFAKIACGIDATITTAIVQNLLNTNNIDATTYALQSVATSHNNYNITTPIDPNTLSTIATASMVNVTTIINGIQNQVCTNDIDLLPNIYDSFAATIGCNSLSAMINNLYTVIGNGFDYNAANITPCASGAAAPTDFGICW